MQPIARERGHMGVPVRDWTHWAVGYAPSRTALRLLARRGDPLAKLLTIEINPVNNIYPLIEQVRRRGRMSPILMTRGWVTADAQIVREVLRDGRFRTIKPQIGHLFGWSDGSWPRPTPMYSIPSNHPPCWSAIRLNIPGYGARSRGRSRRGPSTDFAAVFTS